MIRNLKILLLIVVELVSLSLKGQSIKDFYIPVNCDKASFYQPDKNGDKLDLLDVVEYNDNGDGSYNVVRIFYIKGERISKSTETVVFTKNSVVRKKSISINILGVNKETNQSEIILKMPPKGKTVTWNSEYKVSSTASWTTIVVEGVNRRAIKVTEKVTEWKSRMVSYYVEGIGLMKKDLQDLKGNNSRPFRILDELSND